MGKKLVMLAVGLAMVALTSQAALAQYGGGGGGYDYGKPAAGLVNQLKTAQTHSSNAARAETLRDSLWHLGHVVNCLEGARGKNYDAKNLNPCQGQGGGVIPDLEGAAQGGQMGMSSALDTARKADQLALDTLKLADLAQVKAGASRVADMLGQVLKTIGQ